MPDPQVRRDRLPRVRRAQIARQQQRTRSLGPLLPVLVAQAEKEKRDTASTLARARAAEVGDQIEVDGQLWTVAQASLSSPLAITDGVTRRNVVNEEEVGFWTWAIVETLRHSGVSIEELLEMTHLALQPYTIKPTGETIPLLHIPPSKNDEERMLVASPELVHVLYSIIKRIRDGREAVPLTQRWDPTNASSGTRCRTCSSRSGART